MNTMTKEEIAYGVQKNREHIWNQAKQECKAFKIEMKDFSKWDGSDEAWTDYRYMELCEKSNITPWQWREKYGVW